MKILSDILFIAFGCLFGTLVGIIFSGVAVGFKTFVSPRTFILCAGAGSLIGGGLAMRFLT